MRSKSPLRRVHPRKRAVASALGPGPDTPPTHGFMEYDAVIADRLEPTIGETCQAAGKRPHIIMVHDESSFDITAAPGIRIPPDYRRMRMVGGRQGDPLGGWPGASHCGIYSALITSSLVDLGLLVQNHVQQGTVDFNLAVVINKTQFPKSVHEKAHARSRRADHLRQCLLADFRYDWLRPTFLAKIRQKQKGPCQPFLARIEQLIDQVLLDTTVASQEVRDK